MMATRCVALGAACCGLLVLAPPLWPQQLSLADALARAQGSSPELEALEARAALLARRFQRALRDFLPTVEVGYDSADTVLISAPDSRRKVLSATVSQLVYDGGRLAASREAQRLQLLQLRIESEQLREGISESVWRAYTQLQVLAVREELEAQIADVTAREVLIARRQHALGAANGDRAAGNRASCEQPGTAA